MTKHVKFDASNTHHNTHRPTGNEGLRTDDDAARIRPAGSYVILVQGEMALQVFYVATRVCTGLGSLSQLGAITRQLGERALWVCGPSALQRSGILDRGLELLSEAGVRCSLYDQVTGEPTLDMVKDALQTARRDQSQVVIGVGGGSAMDVAKAVAVLFSQPAPVEHYHRGEPIDSKGLPCILVPTTAGTGTEVTNNAVLTDNQRGIKQSLRGTALFADVAIVDPELTVSLPPEVTASTGADALCQAIEAYVSLKAQPPTDALAGQAIRWIGRSLVRAYEHGVDLQARSDMLYGSLLTGMCTTHSSGWSARPGASFGSPLSHPSWGRVRSTAPVRHGL